MIKLINATWHCSKLEIFTDVQPLCVTIYKIALACPYSYFFFLQDEGQLTDLALRLGSVYHPGFLV